MFWLAWEQYDDREQTCWATNLCLDNSRIQGQTEPFEYYNGVHFADEINKVLIYSFYWTIFGFSLVGFFGSPIVTIMSIATKLTVLIWSVLQLFQVFEAIEKYDAGQIYLYSLENWFWGSFVWWVVGTDTIVNILWWSHLVPFWGPVI